MSFLLAAAEAIKTIADRIRAASKRETDAKREANKAAAEREVTEAEERERSKTK